MKMIIALFSTCAVLSLSGCGGGGGNNNSSANNIVSGIVADGYINGATVCLDINKNTVCDPNEPTAQSKAGGAFSLTLANPNDINLYPLIAEVPATAIDEDTGLPVKNGYVLSALSGSKTPFISPISTLIQSKIAQGVTPAQAIIDVKIGLGFPANSTVDITSNFINSTVLSAVNKQKLRISAQVVARILAANNDVLKAILKKAGINKPAQANALIYKKVVDQFGPIQQYVSSVSTLIGPVQTVNIPSTINLYLKSSNLSTGLGLTPTQKNQLNTTLKAQGSVGLSPAPASVTMPDTSCVTPPNSLGGLSYVVSLGAGQKKSYCFEVKEAKQDVIIKTTNTLNSVNFILEKEDPAKKGTFSRVDPLWHSASMRFSDADPRAKPALTKGIYKITFSEDVQWFTYSKGTKATVDIYSNSISRLVKKIGVVTQNKFILQPYPLAVGTSQAPQTIKGSLNLVQDRNNKGSPWTPAWAIEDVIPLQLSNVSLANVSFNVQTGAGVQVALMNAAYALSILNQNAVSPADWQIWKGTPAQLKTQKFNFIKSNDTTNAYYLVLTRPIKANSNLLNAADDVPYTVTVTTNSLPSVSITTGKKTYQVSNYDVAGTNVVQSGIIKTVSGIPVNSSTEFLTTPQNAKKLTSAMQTFKSVMEFDESALMRFYADYRDNISGLNYANIGTSVYDLGVTAYVKIRSQQAKKDPIGFARSIVASGLQIGAQHGLDQSLKTEASNYIQYSNAVLREYSKKKKLFINDIYMLRNSINADLIGSAPLLQSKLMELFVLQSRATRSLKYGMDIYKASANTSFLPSTFFVKRMVNFAVALLPNDGIGGLFANAYSIGSSLMQLTSAIETGLNVVAVRQTSWINLLNDSKYFSYYDTAVQTNNIKILVNQKSFVIDTTPPAVTAPANITVIAAKGATSVPASNFTIYAFLIGDTATDNVGVLSNTSNAPMNFPMGVTTVTFTATDAAGNIGTATATVTVNKATAALPTLSITNARVAEGSTFGTTNLTFTVTLSAASNTPVTALYTTADGTAFSASDYTASTATLTIPTGATSGAITVLANADTLFESNETFTLTLSNPTGATITTGKDIATGTILNDDAGGLNDTGITTWGNATVNNLTATQVLFPNQDADVGRDANPALNSNADGKAGFSFTKLDAAGQPLANQAATYAVTPWSCVQDNVTGLMWEVKTPVSLGSLHDANRTYTWFNPNPASNGGFAGSACSVAATSGRCDTEKYIAAVNAVGLCGFKDWRLPEKKALISIVDYNIAWPGPTIDVAYFPNTVSSRYWSASPYAGKATAAWYVDFNAGQPYFYDKSPIFGKLHVRLVRGGQ